MNQQTIEDDNYEMRPEYDFSHAVRGKHFEAYRAGTNVVFLEPDVAKAFADSASVNRVLRLLLRLARTNIPVRLRADQAVQPGQGAPRRAKKPKSVRPTRS